MHRILFLALLLAPPLVAQRIEQRWPLDADGMVRIHDYNGSVKIVGWSKDSVSVTGTTSDPKAWFGGGSPQALKFGVDAEVKGPTPRADLTVYVPARARIWVRGAATEVDAREIAGTIDVAIVGGRVHVAGTPREVYAETMDGSVEVEASPVYFRARTATGRITWSGSGDEVSLATVSGKITVNGGRVLRARFESINGDIAFGGGVKPDANVVFDTHGGDITVRLASDARGEMSVDAPSGELFGKGYKGGKGAGEPIMMAVPRGGKIALDHGANITVRTFKGRVTVTQEP